MQNEQKHEEQQISPPSQFVEGNPTNEIFFDPSNRDPDEIDTLKLAQHISQVTSNI